MALGDAAPAAAFEHRMGGDQPAVLDDAQLGGGDLHLDGAAARAVGDRVEVAADRDHALVRDAPLEAEHRELERLKMAVHLAGTRDRAPVALGELLEARCREHFRVKAARRTPMWTWLVPLSAVGAAAIALVVSSGPAPSESGAVAVAVAPADPSDLVLARLVDFHRKGASPMALADLSAVLELPLP